MSCNFSNRFIATVVFNFIYFLVYCWLRESLSSSLFSSVRADIAVYGRNFSEAILLEVAPTNIDGWGTYKWYSSRLRPEEQEYILHRCCHSHGVLLVSCQNSCPSSPGNIVVIIIGMLRRYTTLKLEIKISADAKVVKVKRPKDANCSHGWITNIGRKWFLTN